MLKNGLSLELLGHTQAGNLYHVSGSTDGDKFLLKAADPGNSRRPVYYISRIRDNKAEYITGLFKTQAENIYSGDEKDALGVKTVYHFEFSNNGERVFIKKK